VIAQCVQEERGGQHVEEKSIETRERFMMRCMNVAHGGGKRERVTLPSVWTESEGDYGESSHEGK